MKSFVQVAALSFLVSVILFPGCGSKSDESKDEQSIGTLEQLNQAAKGMKEAAEGMSESMTQKHEPVPPVSFKVLIAFLPTSVGSLKAEEPEGETATMGEWTFSNAKIQFNSEDGSQSARVEIFDYAYISMLYAPYQMLLKMNYNRESTKGYERSTKIGAYPAFEKWEEHSKNATVNVLLGDRFIVNVETSGLGEGSARTIAEGMKLKELASQKAS